MKIGELYFGDPSGEQESVEQENSFIDMFLDTDSYYTDLKDTSKFLILGRKGVGKTTLAKYYEQQHVGDKNIVTKFLSPSHLLVHKVRIFNNEIISIDERVNFMKYCYLVDMGNMLLSHIKENFNFCKRFILKNKLRKVESLITDTQFKLSEIERTYESGLGSSIGLSETKVDTGLKTTDTERYAQKRYLDFFNDLQMSVRDLLISSKLELVVFYDDIDELEESLKDIQYFKSYVNSMVNAAKSLNLDLYSKTKSKVVLLLRHDIVKMLHRESSTLAKITAGQSIELNWMKENGKKSENPHELENELSISEYRDDINKILSVISQNQTTHFEFQQLDDFIKRDKVDLSHKLIEVVDEMLLLSILGIRIKSDPKQKKTANRYKEEYAYRELNFRRTVNLNTNLIVHSGLRKSLSLR